MAAITKAGFRISAHPSMDAAVKATLDALTAAKGNPVPLLNRIENIERVQPKEVARSKAPNVTASLPPNHGTISLAFPPQRVGLQSEARAHAWKAMLENGVTLAYGVDYPTSPRNA